MSQNLYTNIACLYLFKIQLSKLHLKVGFRNQKPEFLPDNVVVVSLVVNFVVATGEL